MKREQALRLGTALHALLEATPVDAAKKGDVAALIKELHEHEAAELSDFEADFATAIQPYEARITALEEANANYEALFDQLDTLAAAAPAVAEALDQAKAAAASTSGAASKTSDTAGAPGGSTPQAPAITLDTTTPLPIGAPGQAYSASLAFKGGTAPYSVSASPETVNGLSVNSTGAITGTPVQAVNAEFALNVSDSSTPPLTALVTVSVDTNAPPAS